MTEPRRDAGSRGKGRAVAALLFIGVAIAAIAAGAVPGAAAARAAVKGVPAPLYSFETEKLARSADADLSRMVRVRLVSVTDGDTVRVLIPEGALAAANASSPGLLEAVERVRLVGVDAPELAQGGAGGEPGAAEATEALERLLRGGEALLAFDRDLRDAYGRLLCYLYLPDGTCVNLELVARGNAAALLKYPFRLKAEFSAAERRARDSGLGLWKTGG